MVDWGKRYASIAAVNGRRYSLPSLLLALVLLALLPVLFGMAELDAAAAAQPLEMGAVLIGVVLLVPVCAPELDSGVRETADARRTPAVGVCLVRTLLGAAAAAVLLAALVGWMGQNGCQVSALHWFDAFAGALFLGGLGMLALALAKNQVVGYMVPLLYYSVSLVSKKGLLGLPSLLAMSRGEPSGAPVLAAAGVGAVALALLARSRWKAGR